MIPADALGRPRTEAERLAAALGWFSIGLGLAETLAPRSVARLIGVPENNSTLLRAMGMREMASGIGILIQPRPAEAVMSRVAGDMIDLGLLGAAMMSPRSDKARVCGVMTAVAGVTALDILCSQQLTGSPRLMTRRMDSHGRIHLSKSVAINRPPEEVHRFWGDLSNLPRFMYHLESVQMMDGGRSHWVAKGPLGRRVEWDAEITEDSGNRIAWRSLPGADVENSGSVWFEHGPGGRGTTVRVELEYNPPAGVSGVLLAKLAGEEPEQQLYDDLRRLKQVMETGEVVLSDACITNRPTAAQPAERRPLEAGI